MEPVIRVEDLTKRYAARGLARRSEFTAIDSVSLSISAGSTLALVGESGSGKSTVGLCMACLERVTSGKVWFDGRDLATLGERELRTLRPNLQIVFQDPATSLNPRWRVAKIVSEPLLLQGGLAGRDRA